MSKPKTIRSKSGYHDVAATGSQVFLGKDVFPSESVRRQRLANDTNEQGVELKAIGPMPPKERPKARAATTPDPEPVEAMREAVETALRTIMLLDGDWPKGDQGKWHLPLPIRTFHEGYGRQPVARVRVQPSARRISEADAMLPRLYALPHEEKLAVVMRALGWPWRVVALELACDWRKAKNVERAGLQRLAEQG